MHKLFHISFIFLGVPKMRDLEVAFTDPEDDWIRLSAFTWLLWSPKPVGIIYNRIKPLLDTQDKFFISEVEIRQTAGFIPPWAWTWINNKLPGSISVEDNPLAKLIAPPKYPSS